VSTSLGAEYWDGQAETLKKAWQLVPPLHSELYQFNHEFITKYLSPEFVELGEALRRGSANETALKTLFREVIPGQSLAVSRFHLP